MSFRFSDHLRKSCALLLLIGALAACDELPDWLGGSHDKVPLAGKRISVLGEESRPEADDSIKDVKVTIPDIKSNQNWAQAGGGPLGMTGNLNLSGLTHHDSESIGHGNGWDEPLYSAPVVANGTIYAMDAKGYVTAHDAMNISKIRWTNKSAVSKHKPDLMGGGLGYDNDRLYVTSGRGKVFALNAITGKEIWKQTIDIPLRAAPKAGDGKVYVLSVDNQLFALNADTGAQIWSHRGINENAGFLAAVSPSFSDSVVLAPYSSGEIHALDTVSGQDLWNDTLLLARRTLATSGFSGIGGIPIIKDDIVYATGAGGFTAAISLLTGRRIWEQDISSLNTPWIADDYLYIISNDNQLICIMRPDGRIKWVKQLPQFEDEVKHKHPLFWRGPVMAGGQLLITGSKGQMLSISPKDGSSIATIEIPENIFNAPIVAGGRLYMISLDAKLHVLY